MRARLISGLPADLVGSLTGLTQGHFPVHASARYADDLAERDLRRLGRKVRRAHNAAKIVDSNDRRRSINIYARRGAPVIAVNDGVVQEDRQEPQARPLHRAAGRLRQPLHLRAPRQGLEALPGPKTFDDHARPRRVPLRAPAAGARDLPKPDGPRQRRHAARPGTSRGRATGRPRDASSATGTQPQAHATEKERLFANPSAPGQPRGRRGDRPAPRPGRLRGVQGLLLEGRCG